VSSASVVSQTADSIPIRQANGVGIGEAFTYSSGSTHVSTRTVTDKNEFQVSADKGDFGSH
jgi:hypothetical protein